VKLLLGLRETLQADAADALAIAICHSQVRVTKGLMARALLA
jgi:Holliday junction resolvasome RuvABC endonuclease subunit